MAIFKGGKDRDDTFTGSTKADRFEFDPVDLTSGDMIVGGLGRAVDTLAFTAAGTIEVEDLANVSGIERIQLAAARSTLVLDDAFVSSATGTKVTVISRGDDTIDAAALTGANAVSILAAGVRTTCWAARERTRSASSAAR